MLLTGTNLRAVREFHTMVSGDRQEFKRLSVRVQDNPQELLAIINQNVTRAQAERSKYVSIVVSAIERAGLGHKIRFKPETPDTTAEKVRTKNEAIEEVIKAPYFGLMERMGLAGRFIKFAAANA